MLKSTFAKVLFEKRLSIFLWSAIILVSNAALALLFPAIRDTIGTMTASVPAGMENWFGDADTWQTYTGFAGQELFGQMAIILVIMAILCGAGYLAGTESKGTLLTLLSRPISRQSVYWQSYLACVIALLVGSVGFFSGIVIGGWLLGEPVEYGVFLQSMLMVFLMALSFGSLAFAIGAITGSNGVAGIIVGVYALIAYLLASLSTATEIVDKLSYGSLFRYGAARDVIADGLNLTNIAILVGVSVVSVVVAHFIFIKRDLRTR